MILDWLGDLGGLLDALVVIFGVLMGPVESFTLKAHMMSNMFSLIPDQTE